MHGSLGVVKPDVTAPGDTIASAGVGQGSGPLVLSGTSMSAPLAAGIRALVRSRHPHWSPLLVKAAVMNTATHDLWTGRNTSGLEYGPNRVGAGRVDALAAVSTPVIAFSPGANNPVTASFGVVPAPVDQAVTTKTLPLTVVNKSTRTSTYRLSYEPVVKQPGVSYTVSPATLTLDGQDPRIGHGDDAGDAARRCATRSTRPWRQTQQGEARQYVSDASGRVLVTPAGEAGRPGAGLRRGQAGLGHACLGGREAHRAGGPRLLPGKRQHGVEAPSPPCWSSAPGPAPSRPASRTRPVAARTPRPSAPVTCSTSGPGSTGKLLWFGLSTYANWAKIGTNVVPYVDFDTNGDGEPDYETYATYLPGTDVLVAETYDLNDPDFATVDVQPVNFNYGDVDTNVFDTNVLTLPVSKKLVGLNNGRGTDHLHGRDLRPAGSARTSTTATR